jgi:hypothetical protein
MGSLMIRRINIAPAKQAFRQSARLACAAGGLYYNFKFQAVLPTFDSTCNSMAENDIDELEMDFFSTSSLNSRNIA